MITHKIWFENCIDRHGGYRKCRFEGWFLMGCFPVYTRQLEWPTN